MAVSKNIQDFTELVVRCLNAGWAFKDGQPPESALQDMARIGRARELFSREWKCEIGKQRQVVHLIRGQDEVCTVTYEERLFSIGGWSAWVEQVVASEAPTPSRRDLIEWI